MEYNLIIRASCSGGRRPPPQMFHASTSFQSISPLPMSSSSTASANTLWPGVFRGKPGECLRAPTCRSVADGSSSCTLAHDLQQKQRTFAHDLKHSAIFYRSEKWHKRPSALTSGVHGQLRRGHRNRVWSKEYSVDKVKTPKGKEFRLVNLPFYLIGRLHEILDDVLKRK